jgi:uncharacterized repeat protein (TIGR01451 family)
VTTHSGYYGASVANTATCSSTNAGSDLDSATFRVVTAPGPNLSGSAKSSSADRPVLPGSLIVYTITLRNSGLVAADVAVTDVLGSYYTVYDAGTSWVESPSGTLTWSGSVGVGRDIILHFTVQVAHQADLPLGLTTLNNALQVYDGENAPFEVQDATPPWIEIRGAYLPLVIRGSE